MADPAQQPNSWLGRTFTTVDPPGSILTIAYDVENSGQIAGFYVDGLGHAHGFLNTVGAYQFVDDPSAGPIGTYAQRANDSGQIVGTYVDENGTNHSFLGVADGFSNVTFPQTGPGETDVWDINQAGTIAGLYFDSGHTAHGFVLSGDVYESLDDPLAGPRGTMAIGINDTGSVVGHYYDNAGNAHGFLETGGEYVTIDDPFAGTKGTFPKEVNNHGQVVGVYYDQTGAQHAFIYDAGSYVTVDNPLGVKGTLAYGINDSGQIVGYFKDADGNAHGFASGPANVTPQDIQSANLTILRVGIDDQSATSLANAMNSGSVIAANYISGLARSAANTSAAVLSISELMGMPPDSQTLDDETHLVASTNAQFGVANGWIQFGAAIAQLSSSFQSEYANLNQDDFINAITSKVFGASSNTEPLRSELSVYEAYFNDGAGGADPTAELRARGAFAADMLHQASDYAATHAGSSCAAFQQASEAFLVGLVEGTKQYGDSIFA